ncbi:inositol-3-phosphate synthase [Listeria booriae]|uniref:inositol-3-phosphate synthase n=1 Tax=Listeria booriae TaxID=1552123 RepID=UPI0016242E2E|nr:myo-inositol-1-phosphate synthase [Listeria booriae]MBC1512046.1 myo-inositol-1-phosphate synthase [Listeria booriae]MBC6150842.1 myo-inositol-1-phosphate synthase [Listeria booriae]MBC6305092.1 myo-inositol-1-phosphate synthase [Listeria booriae]
MSKVKVSIAGVGCCASSLIQLVQLAKQGEVLNGIMFETIGKYKASDIEFVSAFDVSSTKVGHDISEAIFAYPNVAEVHVEVPYLGVCVNPGVLNDGLDGYLSEVVVPSGEVQKTRLEEIIEELKNSNADVLVCYLPTGAANDVRNYAQAALEADVAFINCTPEIIARDEELRERFLKAGLPLLGDDMRSHLGATTLHTALIELFRSRGISIDNTYQLNFGGNMDFYNLSDSTRNRSKQKSKKNALFASGINATDVAAGPNGYVKYLEDQKVCYLRLEGTSILNSKINMEVRLDVEDSPNSAGVIVSAVRIAKTALDNLDSGTIVDSTCPCLFKSSVEPMSESEGLLAIQTYVKEHTDGKN